MRKHGVSLATKIVDHVPVLMTWYVVDCSCGWQSPLCISERKAHTLYERHMKRKPRRDAS